MNHAERTLPGGNDERRAAGKRNRLHDFFNFRRQRAADELAHCVRRAFADLFAFKIHAAHPRLRGKRHELRTGQFVNGPGANAKLFGEHDDAAAFRRFIGERGELCGVGQFLCRHPGHGQKGDRLAVAQRDGTGLVEQQHVHIAGRLDGAAAHREDVALEQTVHAGDADGAQQTADGGRNQANQQRDEHDI